MGVRALSATITTLPIGGRWLIEVETTDDRGYAVAGEPSVVVTLPAGTTTSPTFELYEAGRYRAAYAVGTAGRYVARVTTADDAVDFTAWAEATTAGTGMPAAGDFVDYAGPTSHSPEAIQSALDAEAAAQRAVCRVGAVYPADLREALLRRVARNLAMRKIPLAIEDMGDAGISYVPGRDPEVRRLEAPHRKWVIG